MGYFKIDLDGTNGYGTAFLEESFGGLIRECNFTLAELKPILRFKSEDEPGLIVEIEEYMSVENMKLLQMKAKDDGVKLVKFAFAELVEICRLRAEHCETIPADALLGKEWRSAEQYAKKAYELISSTDSTIKGKS